MTYEQAVEAVAEMLIPFICEHTGHSRDIVEDILAAEGDFWESHPHGIILPREPGDQDA